MGDSIYEIGLGEVGDATSQIFNYLAKKKDKEETAGRLKSIASSKHSTDQIVNDYLNVALRTADKDPALAEKYIESALKRAGDISDAQMQYFYKDPETASYISSKGELDIDKLVRRKREKISRRDRVVKFLSEYEPDQRLSPGKRNLMHFAKEQGIYEESADPLIRGQEFITAEEGKTSRTGMMQGDRVYNQRLTTIRQDKTIANNGIAREQTTINKLTQSLGLEKEGTPAYTAIQNDITLSKAAIDQFTEQIADKLNEELQVFEESGAVLGEDAQKKEVLRAFSTYRGSGIPARVAAYKLGIVLKQNKMKPLVYWGISINPATAEEAASYEE